MLIGGVLFIIIFWVLMVGLYLRGVNNANEMPKQVTLDVTEEDPTEQVLYDKYIKMYREEFNDLKRQAIKGQAVKVNMLGTVYTIESKDDGAYKIAVKTENNDSLFIYLSSKFKDQVLQLKEGQKLDFIGYLKIEEPLISLGDRSFAGVKYPNNLYIMGDADKEKSKQELALARKALLLLKNQGGEGSGTVINDQGFFVTTYDYVKRYEDKTIAYQYIFDASQKETISAAIPTRMIAYDEKMNIALMKLEGTAKSYDFLKMGTRYKEAQRVASIRNRKRLKDTIYVITEGRLNKVVNINEAKYLVTPDTMYPEGVGGMVLNSYGEIIGMNSFRWLDEYAKEEMNFALSAEDIMAFIDREALKSNIKITKNTKDIFTKTYEEYEMKPTDFERTRLTTPESDK